MTIAEVIDQSSLRISAPAKSQSLLCSKFIFSFYEMCDDTYASGKARSVDAVSEIVRLGRTGLS